MSRKNVLNPSLPLVSGQSLSANFTSPVTTITFLDNCSYQINVTTTDSTGSFYVQGSNDYKINEPTGTVANTGNWADLSLSGTPVVNAANDTILIDLKQLPYNAIRLRYASSVAGTGTCNIYIMSKTVGA